MSNVERYSPPVDGEIEKDDTPFLERVFESLGGLQSHAQNQAAVEAKRGNVDKARGWVRVNNRTMLLSQRLMKTTTEE